MLFFAVAPRDCKRHPVSSLGRTRRTMPALLPATQRNTVGVVFGAKYLRYNINESTYRRQWHAVKAYDSTTSYGIVRYSIGDQQSLSYDLRVP